MGRGAHATYVLKVDTDALVNYPLLLRELRGQPRRRLMWGRRGGPHHSSGSDWPAGFALPPALAANFAEGADSHFYLAGMGYAVSGDLAADISAIPFAALVDCGYLEDVCVGFYALPFGPLQVNDRRVCDHVGYAACAVPVQDTIIRHHVRADEFAGLLEAVRAAGAPAASS